MKKAIALLVIAAALVIPYFVLDGETELLDEPTRAGLPGSYIQLSAGVTQYQIDGPEDGSPVVLVSGYSAPYEVWDPTIKALSKAGFRVLRYNLYGRGYSDRPRVDNNPDLFDTQLTDLLDRLKIDGPVDLIGLSMGGAISVNFTRRHPNKVRKLILVDPYGFPQELGFLAKLIKVPYLGEYMMAVAGDKVMMGKLPKNFYRLPPDYESIKNAFVGQMKYKGYKKSLLSSMRHLMAVDFTETYQAVGKQNRPVCLFWGKEDAVVPFPYSEKVKKAIPNVEFHAIDGAGHEPQAEKPDLVNRIMIEFLKK